MTSGVRNKEPVDEVRAIGSGQRLWVHLRVRNRTDETRLVHVAFRVNDAPRTQLDLKVKPSWSFRTWAFNTLKPNDKTGKVIVRVTDVSTGQLLAEQAIPIKAKTQSSPLPNNKRR